MKSIVCVALFIGFSFRLDAISTRDLFKNHSNKYFVETGSYLGNGISQALDAGFEQIYSIELAQHFYEICLHSFASFPNVHLFYGDSATSLSEVLTQIHGPATFWLDGHYSWGNTARGKTNTPILMEIESIGKHRVKIHTILVDDIRQCGTVEFDFIELSEIIDAIMRINPHYKISFEDGGFPNDVLVAEVPLEWR